MKFFILPSLVATRRKENNLPDNFCVSVEPEICATLDKVRNTKFTTLTHTNINTVNTFFYSVLMRKFRWQTTCVKKLERASSSSLSHTSEQREFQHPQVNQRPTCFIEHQKRFHHCHRTACECAWSEFFTAGSA